jgi:hypothetical protein
MALGKLLGGRFAPTIAILVAVVSLPLLPPQHLHRAGIEGRTEPLVHAHLTDRSEGPTPPSGTTALSFPHGDHRLALFLNGDCTMREAAGVSGFPPATIGVISRPMRDRQRVVPRRDAHRIHGPPRFVSITRGPPILS